MERREKHRTARAAVEFEAIWESSIARHRERFMAPAVNFWRDLLHGEIAAFLGDAERGEKALLEFAPGVAVPPYDEKAVVAVPASQIRLPAGLCGDLLRTGRFYPRGILSGAGGLFFAQDVRPFRVTAVDSGWIVADCNHPLALHHLALSLRVHDIWEKDDARGGRCTDWLEEVLADGPGMEGRWKGLPTDFGPATAFRRDDEGEDGDFYAEPRMVGHVDSRASRFLEEEYLRHLDGGKRVLDLMSSLQSHLAPDAGLEVVGLGMNGEEMAANHLLSERLVHDLNGDPRLPFPDGSFDAVFCSLSYEYLTRPLEVLLEIARLLRPGGAFCVGLSNRWFPPKVTHLWKSLHEFERMGLVLEHLAATERFSSFETLAVRNWPRPSSDRHWPRFRLSDPAYVVSARRFG